VKNKRKIEEKREFYTKSVLEKNDFGFKGNSKTNEHRFMKF